MERPVRLLPLASAACVLALTALGCAAPVEADTDAGTTQRLSLVEVKALHAASDGTLLHLDAAARFVAVREPGRPSEALELLGLGWQSIPAGTCAVVDEAVQPTQTIRVDLRDLSPVNLEVRGEDGLTTPLALEPRAFPDVVGMVSGVVFVAPAFAPVTTAKSVSLSASGVALGGFDLPEPPRLELVGATGEGGTFSLLASHGVDLVDSSVRTDERVAVDVIRAGVVKSRCVLGDGRLHLDGASLGGVGEASLLVRAQRRAVRDGESGAIEARLERDVEVRLLVK
ncbi:MAG: hypothetical protein ACXVEF_14860 [Polyangiales bacterium]